MTPSPPGGGASLAASRAATFAAGDGRIMGRLFSERLRSAIRLQLRRSLEAPGRAAEPGEALLARHGGEGDIRGDALERRYEPREGVRGGLPPAMAVSAELTVQLYERFHTVQY